MDIHKKNRVIISSMIFYLILFFTLIFLLLPNYATLINGIFVLALTVSSFLMFHYKKLEVNEYESKITRLVFISILVFFTIIYLLGIFTGYGRSVFSVDFISIMKNAFIPLTTVILLELFRYMFISNNKGNKHVTRVITILIIFLDIAINLYRFDLTISNIFIFLTVTVLPLVFKNIMLSYITKNVNYVPCLIYVIPLCLYKYIVLYKPLLGNYLSSVLFIALPALIYIYSSRIISSKIEGKKGMSVLRVVRIFVLDIPLILCFTIFIGLISGYFKYHLIGVENSTISYIKRGDAIMIDKSYSYRKYEKGDIIAYKDGKKNIIATVSRVEKDNYNNIKVYITTVINTESKDTYKLIEEDNVLGKYVNFKIDYIAKPTVWFKEHVTDNLN
ncbi:MAG: hypothetical protein IKF36_01935 [Bacilli bacterium]|nr:hypothetical protein [Bacilli bacterium]